MKKSAAMNLMCFLIPHRNPVRARAYLAMYQVMAASARRAGIDGQFHFVTYETARLPAELNADVILKIPSSVGPEAHCHLLRIYGWLQYVQSGLFDRPTIAVDPDVLFQQNPAAAFTGDYDIGLTYECIMKTHWHSVGKINSGVMFLEPGNRHAVVQFFSDLVTQIEEIKDVEDQRFNWNGRHPTFKEWGGDEAAIMRSFPSGMLASPNQEPKFVQYRDAVIKTFPSNPWNCQIQEVSGKEIRMPYVREAVIRHFNGNRKKRFFDYARDYLGISVLDDATSDLGISVVFREPAMPPPPPRSRDDRAARGMLAPPVDKNSGADSAATIQHSREYWGGGNMGYLLASPFLRPLQAGSASPANEATPARLAGSLI